jgi:hypothetical protein
VAIARAPREAAKALVVSERQLLLLPPRERRVRHGVETGSWVFTSGVYERTVAQHGLGWNQRPLPTSPLAKARSGWLSGKETWEGLRRSELRCTTTSMNLGVAWCSLRWDEFLGGDRLFGCVMGVCCLSFLAFGEFDACGFFMDL